MKLNKENYLTACINFLKEKIKGINDIMNETQTSANSDTKSSAGDKHETSRAKAHLENERLGGQLEVFNLQLEKIYSINPVSTNTKITFGSIVECTNFTFFISSGLGKLKLVNNSLFYAIAIESPISKQLVTKKIGNEILVGKNSQTIIKIL